MRRTAVGAWLVVLVVAWGCAGNGDGATDTTIPDTGEVDAAGPDAGNDADYDATGDDAEAAGETTDVAEDEAAIPDTTEPEDDTAADATGSGSLAGTAFPFHVDDGAGITVRLAGTDLETTTAADGTWAFDDVPAGTYTVTAEREPYQPASLDGVTVAPGAAVTDQAMTLYLGRPLYEGQDAVVGQPLPDGTHTVFATSYSFMTQVGDLWVYDATTGQAELAAEDVFFGGLLPSPKGTKLLFVKDMTFANGLGDVWAWDFARGTALPLGEQSSPGIARFSDDEERVMVGADLDPVTGTGTLRVIDFATGEAADVATSSSIQWVAFASDGGRLAFLRDVDAGTNSGTLSVWQAATGQVTDVLPKVSQWGIGPVSGTSVDRLWVFADVDQQANVGDLYYWDTTGTTPRLLGHRAVVNQMTTNVSQTRAAFCHDVQTDPETYTSLGTLAIWELGSTDAPTDVATAVDPFSAALPADGARVLFQAHPIDPTLTDVGVWNVAEGTLTPLATGVKLANLATGGDLSVALLTDVDDETQRGTLWTHRYGDAAPTRVADQVARDLLTFGPDNGHLLYKKGEGLEGFDPTTFLGALWAVDLSTGAETALGVDAASVNWWSPDGRLVGYVDHVTDLQSYAGDVRLFDLSTGVGVKLSDGATGDQMQYSPDGTRMLHFRGCANSDLGMWTCGLDAYDLGSDPDVTALQPVAVQEGVDPWSYRFTPDGGAVLLFAPVDTNGHGDVLLHDLATHQTQVLAANGSWYDTATSPDGQWLRITANGSFPVADLWLWNLATREGLLVGQQVHLQSLQMTEDWSRALFLADFGATGDLGTLQAWDRAQPGARTVAAGVPWFTVRATPGLTRATYQTDWDAGSSTGTLWAFDLEADTAPLPVDAQVPMTTAVFPGSVVFPVYGDDNPRAGVYVAPLE